MRPKAVTITTWVMGALNILGYALLLDIRTKPGAQILLTAAVFTLMITAGYVVLWFYWQGRNWARILVFLSCFLAFYNLRSFTSANAIVKVMVIGEAAVAAFLVFWLNTPEARMFFKHGPGRS